jgi:hypothetical protein
MAIDPLGVVHAQPVRIGLQNDQLTEILGGIDDGQLVATSNVTDLAEGDVVSPQIRSSTTANVAQQN